MSVNNVDDNGNPVVDLNSATSASILQNMDNVNYNKKMYVNVMDKISLMSGTVTGILQYESLTGFRNFFIIYFGCIIIYILFICKGKPSRFYANVFNDLVFEHLVRELLGFVMAWTFSFALVG
ncbi:Emc6p PWA37_001791 [Arxiozyma heterogenica]|uniref:ER membrane protein complex subunit 6 n=1 Tax=Arxiozyma heterogenica TaxID=278026 RepID=A0AAN8A8P3_9SACH|nr:hypothetical protein RI543_002386 [Kazachstania heterogenica]